MDNVSDFFSHIICNSIVWGGLFLAVMFGLRAFFKKYPKGYLNRNKPGGHSQ